MYHLSAPRTSRKPSLLLSLPRRRLRPALPGPGEAAPEPDPGMGTAPLLALWGPGLVAPFGLDAWDGEAVDMGRACVVALVEGVAEAAGGDVGDCGCW